MLKKIINILIIFLIFSACNKEFQETELLTPPNLNIIPIEEGDNKISNQNKAKITKQDLIDIEKLLLE